MSEVAEQSNIQLDELVKTYLTIRTERDNLTRQYELKDAELEAEMTQLEQVMLSACNDINADSIRTGSGTIIKSMKESYVCGDWDNFKQYIVSNNAIELLQQRIHQTNFKEYLSTRQDEGLPPGISSMREVNIVVRKPSNKS